MVDKKEYQTLKEYSEALEDELVDAKHANATALVLSALIGAGITAGIVLIWGCP